MKIWNILRWFPLMGAFVPFVTYAHKFKNETITVIWGIYQGLFLFGTVPLLFHYLGLTI